MGEKFAHWPRFGRESVDNDTRFSPSATVKGRESIGLPLRQEGTCHFSGVFMAGEVQFVGTCHQEAVFLAGGTLFHPLFCPGGQIGVQFRHFLFAQVPRRAD